MTATTGSGVLLEKGYIGGLVLLRKGVTQAASASSSDAARDSFPVTTMTKPWARMQATWMMKQLREVLRCLKLCFEMKQPRLTIIGSDW